MIPEGERPIAIVIGENVNKYRQELGMSIKEFCKQLDYTMASYQKLVRGDIEVKAKTIQLLAFHLHISTIDLIEDWSVGE